jgi:hypothetical protein
MTPFKQPVLQLPSAVEGARPTLGPANDSEPAASQLAEMINSATCNLWQIDLGLVPMFTKAVLEASRS